MRTISASAIWLFFQSAASAQEAPAVPAVPEPGIYDVAQAPPPPSPVADEAVEDEGAKVEEVVVTGSRITRDGYETPTPLTVIGEAEIQAEAPANIADFVNTLPSVAGSSTASNSSGALSAGTAGISSINLRALGTGRTLVLFDGQRSVVSAGTGQVDINTFPQALIERVEVVTGGASSVYGSDAIGGVVNFVLDRDYTGVKGAVEYGETTYGDAENRKYTLTAGTAFAEGRGHALLSGEITGQNGIHYTTRDWNESGYFAMRNPDTTPGAPYYYIGPNIGISTYTPGGLITSGPLQGTYFGVNGTVNQLAYGEVSGQWMRGGDWQYTTSGMLGTNSLQSDEDRESIFGRASFMLTPNLEVYGQASYARFEGLSYYINPTTTGITIQRDNAFLPAEVAERMDAEGITSFTMGTSNADMPASGSNNERSTQRYVIGVDGSFELLSKGFKWDAYYQYGVTDVDEQLTPTYNFARLALATDAVFDSSGNIVCRSTLTDPTNGCVPLNRFGVGVASPEALDYVLGEPLRTQEFKQNVAAINFSTSDIGGWAGPVSVAFGAETREEEIDGEVAPEYMSGWKYGNYTVTKGSYDVTEGYVEILVPIVEGLEFNGAARRTDYSTSGGVTTWKAGLTYQPVSDVLFRATQSRDIRAPNLSELFATGTARTNSVVWEGRTQQFVQALRGSTELDPEVADTFGIGVVLTPRILPGFAVSVDYYDIEIEDVIDSVSAEQTVEFCNAGAQQYCDNIHEDAAGNLQTIDLYYENLNSMTAKGLDIDASYRMRLEEFFEGAQGDLSFRFLATHYIENITDTNVTAVDLAGSNAGSTPDWVYRFTTMYALDSWVLNLTARGFSDGVIANNYIECTSDCPESNPPYTYTINDNSVDGILYFDGSIQRNFMVGNANLEAFFVVRNILNEEPELVVNPAFSGSENMAGYVQTNRNLYDVLGRTFRLGVRFEF